MSNLFEVIDEAEYTAATVIDVGVGSTDMEPTPPVQTYPCNFCGHCETPDACAWSRECPVCHAPSGKISVATYCKTPTGAIVGLHAERW